MWRLVLALSLFITPTAAATITNDRGGTVIYYELQRLKWERAGERIAIKGKCASACTIYLKSRNTCVGAAAAFGFHKPSKGTDVLMSLYPGWVKRWIRKHGGLSRKMIWMDASYARRFLPSC